MKNTFRVLLVMVAIWLGQTALAAPRLVFNDTSFDYASHEVAYLHFARAAYSDLLTVYVNDQQEPDGLPLFLGKLAPELTREAIYQQLGVNVSEQALELSFSTQNMGSLELLSYFHSLAPKLGFSKEQELFAGHTYVFSCGCEVHEDTHLRVSFNHVGDFIYVRLALQSPFAY